MGDDDDDYDEVDEEDDDEDFSPDSSSKVIEAKEILSVYSLLKKILFCRYRQENRIGIKRTTKANRIWMKIVTVPNLMDMFQRIRTTNASSAINIVHHQAH